MKNRILSHFQTECPWRDTLYWYDTTDSTNLQAKHLAKQGAPHGTVLIAGHQTMGRGRLGRTFQSPQGQGVYLSVILRPDCPPEALMHLTCAVGVAMCRAVEQTCGVRPQLKWINDLVVNGQKLGGILTEMAVDKGRVEYAVAGIGINCLQKKEDFPAPIAGLATSLSLAAGHPVLPEVLAAAMAEALWEMSQQLFSQKSALMAAYKARCITLGKDIQVLRGDCVLPGKALDLDEDGGLLVAFPDGSCEVISSGEVSVRGLYGYV